MPGPNRRARRLKQTGDFDEIGGITLSGLADGDLLVYDLTSGLWENSKSLTGDYDITGDLALTELTASGQITAEDLTTTDDVTVGDALSVAGLTTLQGAVTADSTLAVTGAATLSDALNVAGALTGAGFSFSGSGQVDGDLTVDGTATLGALTLSGNLTVPGVLDAEGIAIFRDDVNVLGNLSISGAFAASALGAVDAVTAGWLTLGSQPTDPGGANTLFVHDGTDLESGTLEWGGPLVVYGETSIGDPGNEQGSIQVNGSAYDAILKVNEFGGTRDASVIFHRHADAAGVAPEVVFARARGTDSSHTVVQDNDVLGRVDFLGRGDSSYHFGAHVFARVDGTPGADDMPSELVFGTTADGANTPTNRMRIRADGSIAVTSGTMTLDGNQIIVEGDILGIEDLSDPGADRLLFWDDSAGASAFLSLGTGLSITGTTLNAVNTLADLDDTAVSGQSTGDVLYWDGADWADTGAVSVDPAGAVTLQHNGVDVFATAAEGIEVDGTGASNIVLNYDVTGSPSANAVIEVERGTSSNSALTWNETDDRWELDVAQAVVFEADATGINVADGSGTFPNITLLDDAGNELAALFHLGGSYTSLRSLESGSTITIRGRDAGATMQDTAVMDPDGSSDLFYDGSDSIKTAADGASVYDTSGSDPRIYFRDDAGNLTAFVGNSTSSWTGILSYVHGDPVLLSAEDAGGTQRTLFEGDPDDYFTLYHNGNVAIISSNTGIGIRDPDGGEDNRLVWQQSDGTTHAFIRHSNTTSNMEMRTFIDGTGWNIRGTTSGGSTQTIAFMDPDNGLDVILGARIGSPTGGFKGTGTLNATAVYDDNSLLTDYVFDAFHGELRADYHPRVQAVADRFDPAWLDQENYAVFWKEHRRLPGMPDGNDVLEGKYDKSLGDLIQRLLQTAELQAVHIDELRQRIDAVAA